MFLLLAQVVVEAGVGGGRVEAQRQHVRPNQVCLAAVFMRHEVLEALALVARVELAIVQRATVVLALLDLLADMVGQGLFARGALEDVVEVGDVVCRAVRVEFVDDRLLALLE